MATITDFDAWLDQANPEDYEEVYSLYKAVEDIDEFGMFKCKTSTDGKKIFVYGDHVEDTLMLVSDKAKRAFLKFIEERYVDNDLNIEGWYAYKRAMSKND